ncbi:MAG TPA: serine/threonine-protein phosphatase, partial [Bacteroidetes bacterium]|nr:serine/threonine-protein phosphatase [Bacteroidota bacterium]
VLYVVLDWRRHSLLIANAGHHAPLIRRADGSVAEARCQGGFPVGVLEETAFPETELSLESGDCVCLFTDGIVEAGGGEGEEFGEQRLEELIRAHAGESAADIARVIDREATLWSQGRGEPDDRTVIVVKRT